jgi:hypothetical protein
VSFALAIDAGNLLHPANPPTTVLFDDCRKMAIHVSKAVLLHEQCMKMLPKSRRKYALGILGIWRKGEHRKRHWNFSPRQSGGVPGRHNRE